MNCERARQHFVDVFSHSLPQVVDLEFQNHLIECSSCQNEAERVRKVWNSLEQVPAAEPSAALRVRFYEMLDAYEHGSRTVETVSPAKVKWRWWPRQPEWQMAASAACVAVGLVGGMFLSSGRGTKSDEFAQLEAEVNGMRQMVALSLMQQQSASERLRGVNWAYRVEQSDAEVLSALLTTINSDQSANVRLAAVDALRNFDKSPVARKGVAQAILKQTSPLVQIALIDFIGELRERAAVPSLQTLLENPETDPNVRSHVLNAMKQIGAPVRQ